MKQINTKKSLVIIPIILLVVTIFASCAQGDNIPLSQSEIDHYSKDSIGLLNGGINVININFDDYKDSDFVELTTEVSFFNTKDTAITLNLVVEQFYEEREHTVKPNYIYYFLPDISWVSITSQITIQPNNKYNLPIHIKLPKQEAFEKAKGGGYICMVAGYWGEGALQSSAAHKLFLTMPTEFTKTDTTKEKPITIFDILLYSIVGTIVLFVSYKYCKRLYLKRRAKKDEIEN